MKKAVKARGAKLAPIVQIALVCAAAYIGLFVMLYVGVTPARYDIQVGAPAPTQIKASKDIQDTVTTEALRDQEAAKVEPSYKSADPTVADAVDADLARRLDTLRELREEYTAQDTQNLTDAQIAKIVEQSGLNVTRDALATLSETSDANLDAIFQMARDTVHEVLISTLPEGQENSALKSIRAELSQHYSTQLTDIVMDAVRACLRPNMLIDEEITAANRDKAREAVQTVWYVKDQVIVSEGEIVTKAQYAVIASLGILGDDHIDVRLVVGIAAMIALVMLSMGLYLYNFRRDMLKNSPQITLLCLIMALVAGLSLGFRFLNPYLMPVSLGLMLTALLIEGRLAIFVNLMLALMVSMLAPTGSTLAFILMAFVNGCAVVALFGHKTLRTTTLLAGVICAATNFVITVAVGFINSAEIYDVLINAVAAAGSGIVSAILCIGVQPFLEWMFNLATASKLIELSNPNQPLLRRLLLEASGTYHHSIIVANLAEAACSAIGANGLLARVGAYYHDIGKLKRPMYFKENQMGDNPHDRTDPRVSTAILTAHTRDGAQMAQKARIPEPVVDIIRQHHGDTPVLYFYDKALKLYGDQVDISAFRYEGPRPQSREAAVVMLADTIEAATRALPNPDPEKIDALIRKLVRGKLNDGQLDSSSLTFNDLDKICSAFSTVLTGVFHERIEYPDVTIPPRLEKPETPGESAPKAEEPTPEKKGVPADGASASKPSGQPTAPAQNPDPAKSAGQPVPPVQAKPNPDPSSQKPAVSAGQPVPPVQVKSNPEPSAQKPAVSAVQAVPPVQVQPDVKPSEEAKSDAH